MTTIKAFNKDKTEITVCEINLYTRKEQLLTYALAMSVIVSLAATIALPFLLSWWLVFPLALVFGFCLALTTVVLNRFDENECKRAKELDAQWEKGNAELIAKIAADKQAEVDYISELGKRKLSEVTLEEFERYIYRKRR